MAGILLNDATRKTGFKDTDMEEKWEAENNRDDSLHSQR